MRATRPLPGSGAGICHNGRMELIRIAIIAALIGIVVSLGSALYHLSSGKGDPQKMVRALTWRVGLSIGLFVMLFVAWRAGLIQPHGIHR